MDRVRVVLSFRFGLADVHFLLRLASWTSFWRSWKYALGGRRAVHGSLACDWQTAPTAVTVMVRRNTETMQNAWMYI
jgi:hypothetical protein